MAGRGLLARGFAPARPPARRLSAEEADLWARVAETIVPLEPRRVAVPVVEPDLPVVAPPVLKRVKGRVPPPLPAPVAPAAPARPLDRHGLDAGWDKRLAKGTISPDFTLDLHGSTLDQAHSRLDHGLTLALAQGARVVLLVTGRARPVESADRGDRRGAIRAKYLDWLAHGSHASRIAAVRPAHPRHGGGGAVYIVLKRK
ncbi:DNA mismatch repair protein MutS [Novosphingobium sp. FSY-8]|uniref:DNA mismatch repair protein MutS n=1 Tax=Novosphingobium ovatum TaxID=1908523 RepID=A0ABW9XDK2_9SPHN|nr:Smr/MutS family protein [Novosphingobium ovatum]NBC36605.1 DNA mismatch repair protein MutS [Novosphingobium ovatum]